MKIAFYISGTARRLCEILTDERADNICKYVQFVFSDDHRGEENIQKVCKGRGITYIVYNYENEGKGLDRKTKNRRLSDEILKVLQKNQIDYMFLFGHHLLSGEILEYYKNKLICFHPSLLPSYTGMNAIDQAIGKGEIIVGNSAFFVDEGMDTGMVIMQSAMHVSNFGENNYEVLLHPIVDMFYSIFKVLLENRLVIQNNKVVILGADYRKVNYYPEV